MLWWKAVVYLKEVKFTNSTLTIARTGIILVTVGVVFGLWSYILGAYMFLSIVEHQEW